MRRTTKAWREKETTSTNPEKQARVDSPGFLKLLKLLNLKLNLQLPKRAQLEESQRLPCALKLFDPKLAQESLRKLQLLYLKDKTKNRIQFFLTVLITKNL